MLYGVSCNLKRINTQMYNHFSEHATRYNYLPIPFSCGVNSRTLKNKVTFLVPSEILELPNYLLNASKLLLKLTHYNPALFLLLVTAPNWIKVKLPLLSVVP